MGIICTSPGPAHMGITCTSPVFTWASHAHHQGRLTWTSHAHNQGWLTLASYAHHQCSHGHHIIHMHITSAHMGIISFICTSPVLTWASHAHHQCSHGHHMHITRANLHGHHMHVTRAHMGITHASACTGIVCTNTNCLTSAELALHLLNLTILVSMSIFVLQQECSPLVTSRCYRTVTPMERELFLDCH